MPESLRRADRAEAADAVALAANMRAETAMHRNSGHRGVTEVAGMVSRHIGDEPRRQQPYTAEAAPAKQHLIKCRHAPPRREAAAARQSRRPKFGRVVAPLFRIGIGAAPLIG